MCCVYCVIFNLQRYKIITQFLQMGKLKKLKKIEAIIRKSRFEDVKKAFLAADIEWFSYYFRSSVDI